METMDLSEARIYVGTYAKYNNGSLQGEWVELSDFYDLDGFGALFRDTRGRRRTRIYVPSVRGNPRLSDRRRTFGRKLL